MKANSWLAWRSRLLFVGYVLATACAPCLNAQTSSPPKTTQAAQTAAVSEALKSNFGSAVVAVTAFKPFYLTGDFNGDGAPDVAIVVRITRRRSELPADVKVVNPFYRTDQPAYPADPGAKPTLAFAIIHGTKAGWQFPLPAAKFLLVGESPILILENSRASSANAEDAKGLIEIIRKGGRRRGAIRPPATAKGDVILLGTEATESFLYWNGKTYRWEELSDEGE